MKVEVMVMENWAIEEVTGYKPITTFYADFSIADEYGLSAIQDTFNRVFEDWKNNYKYITELSLVLNWKIWRWYFVNQEYGELYDKLWRKIDDYCMTSLEGEELDYYCITTD